MAELVKILSEQNGVSGCETAVRNLIIDKIKGQADNITIDSMGNVLALKKGKSSSKTFAVTAHMDEPGFIISEITDKGYLKFKSVGDVDSRKIISKKVVIGEKNIRGVIGMKAIHLQAKSEREKTVSVSKMFIDIGVKNKDEAEKYVRLGDYVTFNTTFEAIGNNVKGKALERSGICRVLINAMDREYPFDTYFCFLTQHEVGSRGAKIISHRLNPDAVLTVSSVDTADMYGCERTKNEVKIGEGVVVSNCDKFVISDKTLTDSMTVKTENIKTQSAVLKEFSSDAGAIQTSAYGTRCMSISIPCRYSHSPVSLMSLSDVESTLEYVRLFLNKIGEIV